MLNRTDDLRIKSLTPIPSPALLMHETPLTEEVAKLIRQTRDMATEIVQGKDDKLLVIVGPCSIHDIKAALEYADKLKPLIEKYKDELCIVMRVYFEKPRTSIGWKGLINDPHLNNSFKINEGLMMARKLLVSLAEKDVPSATEFLDTIIPQFISDVVCWGAIGARTTESQVHRELASGLSMPVGFKNGTSGDIQVAIDAMKSSKHSHHFLSISKLGVPIIAETAGNDATHIILRGGKKATNYDSETVQQTATTLQKADLQASIMIDCSHGNSEKDHKKQINVVKAVSEQLAADEKCIVGVMIESHLVEGKQALNDGKDLTYGQSVTDACINMDETALALDELAIAVKKRRG